jgi:hypothetical protein
MFISFHWQDRMSVCHILFRTDPLFISTHNGDFNGNLQRMALLGKEKSSLSCLKMIAYDASIADGPDILPSIQPIINIDGHPVNWI